MEFRAIEYRPPEGSSAGLDPHGGKLLQIARVVLRCVLVLIGLSVVGRTSARSESVRLATPTGTLHGTLDLPGGHGPFPVALIIAGSGPTDRNGNDPSLGLDTNCYELLAQYLARRGIASLRYDKRGAGQDFILALPEDMLRLRTFVSDAVQWGERLRHDPRFSTLTVIGDSEGSLIGMMAARIIPATGFVSISGAGEPASDLLLNQLKGKLPGPLYHTTQVIIAQLKAGHLVAHVPPSLNGLFRLSVQPYLMSWFRYNPTREIAKLRIPVLIVQGERDLQVPVADALALHRANPAAHLVLIPHMNHVMKDVGASEQDNIRTYAEPDLPIDNTLARSVVRFILHLPPKKEHAMATDIRRFAVIPALALLFPGAGQAATKRETRAMTREAAAFVHTMAQGSFETAEADFTKQMKSALPPAKLRMIWRQLLSTTGSFQGTTDSEAVARGGYTNVVVMADFKNRDIGMVVTFDSAQKIAGLHFVPAP